MQLMLFFISITLWNVAKGEGFGNYYGAPGYGSLANSPYGYGGMNNLPGGVGYPSLQNPQQRNMALLYSLLAKARQSNTQSASKSSGSNSKTKSITPPDMSKNLEALSKSIAAGQKALAETIKPIPDVDLSPAFSTLLNKKEQKRSDPLAGFSESLKSMNEQIMKTVQKIQQTSTNIEKAQALLISNAVQKPNMAARVSKAAFTNTPPTTFRGIASLPKQASPQSEEPTMHRNLHSGENHGKDSGVNHAHSRSPRITPYD